MKDKQAKYPQLRFKGFTDPWEQRKLGDIVVFLNGRAYKQAELLDSGKYPVLRVGNFNTNDKWYYSDLELPAKNYADKGDLLYTWATAFGPHIWKGPKVIYHYHIWKVETTSDISKNFAVHLLDADQAQMTNSLNGSTMVHITKGTMENKIVTIPGISEQRNMARLLDQLDFTIALHQRKLAKLKELKQGYLQKMFPKNGAKVPELRFAGFADAWEQDKLDYIFDILDGDRGKNYPSESDFLEEGPTLFLDTGNVRKNGFLFNTTKYITKERDCSLRSGKLQLFDFVLTSRGTLGNVAYYDKKIHVEYQSVRINSAMLILRPIRRNIFSDLYLKVILHGNLIENFMKKNHVGSAQPHITKKDFSKMLVGIPSTFKEQQKIGLFFKQLDNTITLHQRKLEKLQELKKGYLQKMFC